MLGKCRRMAILNRVIRKGLIEKVKLKRDLKKGKRELYGYMEKSIPCRWNHWCQGPKAGELLAYLKNNKEANTAGED